MDRLRNIAGIRPYLPLWYEACSTFKRSVRDNYRQDQSSPPTALFCIDCLHRLEFDLSRKPHLLIAGVRRPGKSTYQFRIYGYPGNQFPPIDMVSTLGGLGNWIGQTDSVRDELGLRRAGVVMLPVRG